MFPNQQQQPPAQPPQQGAPAAQPMAPPPAAGGQPPMQQPMPPQQGQQPMLNGEDVQMLLVSRLQEFSDEEFNILDDMITPETIVVLLKLLPELAIFFEKASAFSGGEYAGGGEGQPEEAGGMEMSGEESDGEERNPLVNDNLSRGLMRG